MNPDPTPSGPDADAAEALRAELRQLTANGIEQHRKGDFRITLPALPAAVSDILDKGAELECELQRHAFPFGVCLPTGLGVEGGYPQEVSRRLQAFIAENFNASVCENAMKWYATDPDGMRGDYRQADHLLEFAARNQLPMRGHCLFWDRRKFVQNWVAGLSPEQLRAAMRKRMEAIVPRYRTRLTCWDANNEMLDGGFFNEQLGSDAAAWIFKTAHALDPDTPLFVNEFAILGNADKTSRYLHMVDQLRDQGAPVGGIGIQEHACERILNASGAMTAATETIERVELLPITYPQIIESLDRMAATGLPIHLTEISAKSANEWHRAIGLEALYRIGFSHPAVRLILLWGFWEPAHWLGRAAALIDKDWNLLPAGAALKNLLHREWHTRIRLPVRGNCADFRGFFGTYAVTLHLANGRTIHGSVNCERGNGNRVADFPASA